MKIFGSYLPTIPPSNAIKGEIKIALTCPNYYVLSSEDGSIQITDSHRNPIVKNILWHQEYQIEHTKQTSVCSAFQLITGTDKLILKGTTPIAEIEITLKCGPAKISIQTHTTYTHEVHIFRESLIVNFADPVKEVFLKNRKRHTGSFSREYWLEKQGVKIGSQQRCLYIYHTPGISSLQLQTKKRQLWVNLDYDKDHPFIRDQPHGMWQENSASHYKPDMARVNSFDLLVGQEPKLTPRLMLQPYGHLAAYAYSEHACYTDFRIHKAVYCGSEDIHDPSQAVAGFVKHGIPVTKSVFYANTCQAQNDTQSDFFKGDMVSLKGNPDFLKFIRDLQQLGHEICLHCVQPQTSSASFSDEGVNFMKEHFDMVSWIDHIWFEANGQTRGCHEGFCFKALDESSPACMKSIWEKYGVKYFWNPALEYLKYSEGRRPSAKAMILKCQFLALIQELLTRRHINGSFSSSHHSLNLFTSPAYIPDPLYWLHPTVTHHFYSWSTTCVKRFQKNDKTHSDKQIKNLVDSWGVCLNHAYPTYIGKSNGAFEINQDNKVVISPEFDQLLARLAAWRKKGDLYIATVRDLLDYWIKLDKISFDYLPDNETVRILNHNSSVINGLTLAYPRQALYLNGKPLQSRKIENEHLFWFDMEPLSYVAVSLNPLKSFEKGALS